MKIETKYKIGEMVYAIEKYKTHFKLYEGVIASIVIEKDKITYYIDNQECDEFEENQLIDDIDYLGAKYQELKNKILE